MTKQTPQQIFQEKLQQMQTSFIKGLPARLAEIKETWQQVQNPESQEESLHILHRLVHTITGSAGTFSLLNLGEEARNVENKIKDLVETKCPLTQRDISIVSSMLDNIAQEIESSSQSKMSFQRLIEVTPPHYSAESHQQNKILLVEDDEEVSHYISLQLSHFGYQVQVVSELNKVNEAIELVHPDLIIFDIHFPDGGLAGTKKVIEIKSLLKRHVPVIFISGRQDIQARLSAVRAHGQAYFSKPINISALIEKVNQLTQHDLPEPYHILLVDDDPAVIELASFILNKAGMDASGITNPLNALDKISEIKPDLILLDLHMPECTGIELAKVIRQHQNLSNIPIIFLSAETDSALQLETAVEGGDEFLSKPIKVNELATFVGTRAKRAREISALMIKDGLTNLYNHTYTKELVDREIERVVRSGSVMSVAMIDIDFFKKVNDNYGHMVGDQVLRSLSSYLKKRLRKTDYIGRYGGEEFVIVMPDTKVEDAENVMNTILTAFSYVEHHALDEDFTISFSGGIISSDLTKESSELMRRVDEALYQAKERGRNQMVLAEKE